MSIKKATKAVFTITSFTIATRVLAFIFKIYLSRTVGAEVIGLFQIALSIFGMLTCVTASGIPFVLSRKTAENVTKGEHERTPSLVTSSVIAGILASVFVIIVVFAFKGNLDLIFKDIRAIPIFLIMLPALISTTIYSVFRSWFWGMKEFTTFSLGEFSEEIFRIIFTVLLAGGIISSLKGEIGLAIAFTISDMLCAILMLYLYIRKGGKFKRPRELLPMIKSSAPITAMRLTAGIMSSVTAIVIPSQLTYYGLSISDATIAFGRVVGLAFPLIMIPLSLTSAFTTVIIPEVSGQNALGNKKFIASKVDKAITLSVSITGLFLALYIAFGREIGIVIYNDIVSGEFVKAGAWMMMLIIISQITSTVLHSVQEEKTAFFNYSLGTIFLLALIFILPRYMGVYSIIVANGVFYLITLTANIYALYKKDLIELKFIQNSIYSMVFAIPAAYISRSVFELIAYRVPLLISVGVSSLILGIIYILLIAVSDVIDINYFYIDKRKRIQI